MQFFVPGSAWDKKLHLIILGAVLKSYSQGASSQALSFCHDCRAFQLHQLALSRRDFGLQLNQVVFEPLDIFLVRQVNVLSLFETLAATTASASASLAGFIV
jgi:hypothetical protein